VGKPGQKQVRIWLDDSVMEDVKRYAASMDRSVHGTLVGCIQFCLAASGQLSRYRRDRPRRARTWGLGEGPTDPSRSPKREA